MKIKLLILFSLLIKLVSFSQTYGNEWINYNQTYYKFKVVNEGVYKVDYQTLISAGIDIPSLGITGANMQIFGRDKEQPIVVFDNGDGSFDLNDYILFYADRNNGWLDSTLYEDPNTIGNPGYSIFNDTIYYFFSWNNLTTNKRFLVENNTAYSSHPTADYVWGLSENYGSSYYNTAYLVNELQVSQFSPGEGYYAGTFGKSSAGTTSIHSIFWQLPSLYTNTFAPNAIFHGKSNSNSDAAVTDPNNTEGNNHHLEWSLTSGNNTFILQDSIFKGHRQIITNKNIPNVYLAGSSLALKIVDDLTALTDYQSFSYCSLYYPRITHLNGLAKDKFYIKNTTTSWTHLEFIGTAINAPLVLVFGGTNPKYIVTQNAGGTNFRALISNSGNSNDQKVIVQDINQAIPVTTLTKVTSSGLFTDYSTQNYEEANIMVYHPSLDSASSLYRDYRSQSYNVIYANIDELYLQFGGGIPKHNAAIRRFAHYAYNHSTLKPLAITLLGKGYNTGTARTNPGYYAASVIPCFGNPGSDICFTANLEGSAYAPLIAIGRVSVNTNTELSGYLTKLKAYEVQQTQSDVYDSPNKDWQKQILHFSGGNAGWQQDQFFNYMESFRAIIEHENFAGNVHTFRKVSSDPLDPSLVSQLSGLLENGVSLMNFFGHSSANGFDLTIDEPSNWNNQDKYPVVVGNGCHSGDMFSTDGSFGELLIRSDNEGAIAYIGSSDQEYDNSVYAYCTELYKQFSPKNYGLPISHQIKNTIEYLQAHPEETFYNEYIKGTYGSTNLNGDPLLKLNWHTHPEIEITEESLFFGPETIDLTVDSIELNLVIKNLGRSVTDTFYVEIRRDFPNTSYDSVYIFTYPNLHYKDTLKFKMPLQGEIGVGINNFSVDIDIPSVIEEQYDEINNNRIIKSLFIKLDAIVPIWPYDFAVVPNNSVTVKASTVNPIADTKTYLFELDTCDAFNSTQKRFFTKTGLGGVYEVAPNEWKDINGNPFPLICQDSGVYFWRTAVDSAVKFWTQHSFQYIPGKEGWGQDNFFQFKKNQFNVIGYDTINRKRFFEPVSKYLEVFLTDNIDQPTNYFTLDQQVEEYGNLPYPMMHLAVIDDRDLLTWYTNHAANDQHEGHDLLNYNNFCTADCRPRQEKYFYYYQDSLGLNNLNTALNTLVPPNHHIVLYTSMYADYSVWNLYCPSLYQTLSDLGAVNITPASPERAFIFYTRKGNNVTSDQRVAINPGDVLYLDKTLTSGDYDGNETSTLIGPTTEWKTMYWRQDTQDTLIGDTTRLLIQLYNNQQSHVATIDTVFTHNDSIIDLSSMINAQQYPYIKLKAHYIDYINFTPAQIARWHVLYTPVPEAAIDGSNGYTWLPDMDTLNEGEEFKFAVDIRNISDYHMDSLLVSYFVEDHNHVKHAISYPRQDSLRVEDILRDTVTINTTGYPGLNSLWVEVNPYINGSVVQTDQLEQYHFNNLLQIPFYVRGDDVNPILDVTFEGRHILNGDIVDPNSEILITLKDDNDFLVMDDVSDTTLFGIFLTSPDGVQKRIPFIDGSGNAVLQWYPAESTYKKFKIIYPAFFEQDGVYTLLVQGSDRSGNLSGDIEYRISFEVIHESTITYLMNYPNPFSTSTRFVFTLTGSEIPEEFLIQIMTVSGKVVRQITEDELGPIFIGRNITEYEWNGTDDFGDQLANGVYIYRVLSRLNGEEIKHRETDGDKYFTKEYGKMYIIR